MAKSKPWYELPVEIDGIFYPESTIIEYQSSIYDDSIMGSPYKTYVTGWATYTIQIGNGKLECTPAFMYFTDECVYIYGVYKTYPVIAEWQKAWARYKGIDHNVVQYTWESVYEQYQPEIERFRAGYEAAEQFYIKQINELTERVSELESYTDYKFEDYEP